MLFLLTIASSETRDQRLAYEFLVTPLELGKLVKVCAKSHSLGYIYLYLDPPFRFDVGGPSWNHFMRVTGGIERAGAFFATSDAY
jgi:hypothetical protein